MIGLLDPIIKEKTIGKAEVKKPFTSHALEQSQDAWLKKEKYYERL